MAQEASTLAVVLIALRDALAARGIDLAALVDEVGLDRTVLDNPRARCDGAKMNELWERIVAVTGDPLIGLDVARFVRPNMFNAIGIGVLHSRTVLDALRRIARYFAIVSTNGALELDEAADVTRLRATPGAAGTSGTSYARDGLSVAVLELLRLLAGPDFHPLRVRIRHADYGHSERYAAAYGCPVEFGTDESAMLFDTAAVRQIVATADPDIAAQADRLAERYLERMRPDLASARVRALLLELLPAGELNQEQVARAMHQSTSTLQRHLKREGTSYQDLLDDTRRKLAVAYLQDGRYGLADVAFLLGFADQSNFTRAFKRWTGTTPGAYLAGSPAA